MKGRPWNGKPIGMPGIYSDVPMDDYHSAGICIEPSVSSSTLRLVWGKSPAHAWDKSPLNPKRDPDAAESVAFLVGRAAHHLLFGQSEFDKMFVRRPDEAPDGRGWNGNNLSCRGWLKDTKAAGLSVVTQAQFDVIQGMAESLVRHPLVKNGILSGDIEQSWFWKDLETGLWCKVRPDASPNDSMDFADLKTTVSVDDDSLQRTIKEFGYFQQGALVAEACQEVIKRPMATFTLVFVEKTRPYCVRVVTLKDNDLQRGRQMNRVCLEQFAEGLQSEVWIGPNGEKDDAAYIELKEWDQKQIDARLEDYQSKKATKRRAA